MTGLERHLHRRSFAISIVVAYIGVALAILGLYRVNESSDAADRAFIERNRMAILDGCQEREELRGIVREIMETVIRFNVEDGTAASLRRAEAYGVILDTKLQPDNCAVNNEGG